jgi:transcription termination/antitermination protein NusA
MEVIVPDEFLSVAIGKRGQNVRLASKLTGWHLDVNSESQYNQTMKSGYDSLVQIRAWALAWPTRCLKKGSIRPKSWPSADSRGSCPDSRYWRRKGRQLIINARERLQGGRGAKALRPICLAAA